MFTISPSLYSADLLDLREVIGKLKGFEHLHLDIDDGNFVRGISFGMEVVKGVAECTEIPSCVDSFVVLYYISKFCHDTFSYL